MDQRVHYFLQVHMTSPIQRDGLGALLVGAHHLAMTVVAQQKAGAGLTSLGET